MPFENELLFLGHLLLAGGLLLAAARMGRSWVVAFIVVCTLLMNIVVMKQMRLFGLDVTGGNVLYAAVFLANDVLNEHYGRAASRRAVVIAFGICIAALLLMQVELLYRPNGFDDAQGHLCYFFNLAAFPRIVTVSMISYLLSQLMDMHIYQWIRRRTGPRMLWLRSNASTWISQAFDTVFFTTTALVGTVITSWPQWVGAVIFAYLIKIVASALDTPFLYLSTWRPLCPPGSMRLLTSGDSATAIAARSSLTR